MRVYMIMLIVWMNLIKGDFFNKKGYQYLVE